jgi:hypothetical protein
MKPCSGCAARRAYIKRMKEIALARASAVIAKHRAIGAGTGQVHGKQPGTDQGTD